MLKFLCDFRIQLKLKVMKKMNLAMNNQQAQWWALYSQSHLPNLFLVLQTIFIGVSRAYLRLTSIEMIWFHTGSVGRY